MSDQNPTADDVLEIARKIVYLVLDTYRETQIDKLRIKYNFKSGKLHIVFGSDGKGRYQQISKHGIKPMSFEKRIISYLNEIGRYDLIIHNNRVMFEILLTYIRIGPGRKGKVNISAISK